MKTMRVEVQPGLIRWACDRASLSERDRMQRYSYIAAWEKGLARPTLKQLEKFARAVHVPVGFLFLSEPPMEIMPIPDFRTFPGVRVGRPSPDLLDTVYICQQRQEWYQGYCRSTGEGTRSFVGSVKLTDGIEAVAADIRRRLSFDIEERSRMPTWTDALRRFIEQVDELGVLVMCSSIVQNNAHRRLDPEEFRGFALADDTAPLIFINGADSKSAQMFTLAHEVAHIWLGESALSDAQAGWISSHRVEQWCNRFAAELLVPLALVRAEYRRNSMLREETDRLAGVFKVSTLVILRRIHDSGGLTDARFQKAYEDEIDRLKAFPRGRGGNSYLNYATRVSKRFARALISNTLEGQTLHRDALRMLGLSRMETFRELGRSLRLVVS